MIRKLLIVPAICALLTGCETANLDFEKLALPTAWQQPSTESVEYVEPAVLNKWWTRFDEPRLNDLVETALADSPDRNIAAARILEARGLERTSRSFLFPSLDASATYGRQDTGFGGADSIDNFYDAGFDASYELDLFGRNRNNARASLFNLFQRQAEYQDVSLSLAAEVTRTFIEHKRALKRLLISNRNVQSQQRTVDLITQLYDLGEAPRLDVSRAENLLNTTRAQIPEAERLAENARLRLAVLTGQMPEDVILDTYEDARYEISADAVPLLMVPADVIANRPDVQASALALEQATSLSRAEIAGLFPQLSLSAFYGISDGAFVSSSNVWSVAINAAVNLIDFGRVEGRIDAARAREVQAFEQHRKTVLQAVADVESALVNYAKHSEREALLYAAYTNARESADITDLLYREGESALIDVLDVQRQLNSADLALTGAAADKAESLIALYKSLGVY